jgi:hypothetical protein
MLFGKIRVVEMGRTCCTHGGMAYSFAILDAKPEGKRQRCTLRHKYEDKIKMEYDVTL